MYGFHYEGNFGVTDEKMFLVKPALDHKYKEEEEIDSEDEKYEEKIERLIKEKEIKKKQKKLKCKSLVLDNLVNKFINHKYKVLNV